MSAAAPTVTDADIDRALATFGEALDIDRKDLRTIIDLATDRSARP
ncbi:hypothetical protein BH09PSE1_BH09PSE1_18920 [soil metagenome]